MTLKHLSFLYPIPRHHFKDGSKVTHLIEINVHYALYWNRKVEVEGYVITPGTAKHINDWDKLEEEIKAAAEHNSKRYRAPGERRTSGMRPEGVEPYQDIHDQWKQEVAEKERQGW
jgi:hypothetical protein